MHLINSILTLFYGIVSLLLVSTIPSNLQAQSKASINGFVTDSQTSETLLQANIIIKGTYRGTATNNSGYYVLSNLDPGTYILQVSYLGYQTKETTITVEAGENRKLDIELDPDSAELEDVVIRSERYEEEKRNIGTIEVKTQLIKEIPAVFEADVFRSIQLLPGVKAASDFSSGLYIRGGGPDQTLIMLDRTTVYNPSHFFGFFSTFNPSAIKDIQLYKGGYPAKYGGRLGSVLDVYNKDGNRNSTEGDFSIGLLASRATIEGPYKYGSYMLAVRRSTLEPLLYALRQNVDNIPQAFYFYDVNGKVNFDIDDKNRVNTAFYGGIDYIRVPFAEDANAKLRYGNVTGSVNWTHLTSDNIFSNLTVTGSRYFNFPILDLAGTAIKRDNNVYDYSLRYDLQYIPNEIHDIEAGIWTGHLNLSFSSFFDNQKTFSSTIKSWYSSAYIQDTWRPNPQWKITGGILANYFDRGNFLKIDPRFSVEHFYNDNLRLQASVGGYSQYLTLITNESFSGFDTWLTSANGVEPAYGWQYIVGFKSRITDSYNLDVEAYYRTMVNLFEIDPRIPDVAGLPYPDIFRFGDGYATGLEVFLEKSRGKLGGFIGYTYGISKRKFPGVNLGDDGKARYYSPKYDRTHDINVVLTYNLFRKWKMTSTFNYATGQAYTLPSGFSEVRNDPFDNGQSNYFTVDNVNAARLPAYHRLDLGFSYASSFFGRGKSEWQFQIINVYNRSNIWFYQYDFDQNPIGRNAINLLPLIPNISYSVDF